MPLLYLLLLHICQFVLVQKYLPQDFNLNQGKITTAKTASHLYLIYRSNQIFLHLQTVALISKLDRVAPLITYPPHANFTTMHSRLACQNINLCLGEQVYIPGREKPLYLFIQWFNFKICQDLGLVQWTSLKGGGGQTDIQINTWTSQLLHSVILLGIKGK